MTGPIGALALGLLLKAWLTVEHFLPWVSWHAEVATFAGVWLLAVGAIATDLRLQGRAAQPVLVPSLAIPPLALGLIAWAQYLTGRMRFGGDALVVCFYVFLVCATLAIGYRAARARADGSIDDLSTPAEWLAWTLAAGAALSTVIGFAQVFELWLDTGWFVIGADTLRASGNLAQPNHLATALLMGMVSLVTLHRHRRLGALGCAAWLGFLAFGLAMSGSRSGFLGFFVLLGWWWLARPRVFADVPVRAAAAFGAFYAACYLAWPHLLVFLRLSVEAPTGRFSPAGPRLALWQQLVEAVMQSPWYGWSVLGLAEAHNAVAHRAAASDALTYAHSVILDLAVWIGVPLTLCFVVVALGWAHRRFRAPQTVSTWFGLALALPLAVHSMFEFPYAYAYLLVPAAFGLGYAEGVRGTRPWIRVDARAALAALLATGALLVGSVVEYIRIEDDFRVVRFESLRLGRTPDDHVIPQVVLLTQLGALLTGTRIELRAGMPPAEIDALRALAMRYPWLATQFRYAVALALNGQSQESYRQMQVIRAQRGEITYRRVRAHFIELGQSRYPELQGQIPP